MEEYQSRLLAYQRRIKELEKQLACYQKENAQLVSENEMLHETAWGLIRQLRQIQGEGRKKTSESVIN